MKKHIFFIIVINFFIFFGIPNVLAYDKYTLADYAYFDPVTNSACNEKNYWTPYDNDSSNTCYRFIVLDTNDTASKSKLKVMLDHNLETNTFVNAQSVLTSKTAGWTRYDGSITLPDENTIANIMQLGDNRPEVVDGTSTSISNEGRKIHTLITNTMYVYNRNTINSAGYWLSGNYTDTNYAYTLTEYGNNKLVLKTHSRGIRPMLEIDKSLLQKSKSDTDISNDLKNGTEYKYAHQTQTFDGYTYKQLQGFAVTNSKIVLYSSHNGNPEKGLVISYGGDNFNTLHKVQYDTTGHGNGFAFNTKTNKLLLVGPNDYDDIYEYDADTLTKTNTYNQSTGYTNGYSGLGYDKYHNYYVGSSGRRIEFTDSNFNVLYSFGSEHLVTGQDIEYDNGYVYVTTFDAGATTKFQLYYFNEPYSARVLVFNAKFKADGTPEKDFGRLVKTFYIGNVDRDNLGGTGENEAMCFTDNKAWFGYAAQHYDTEYVYKIYSIPKSKVSINPNVIVQTTETDTYTQVDLKSDTELKSISGWTLSSDKNILSKKYYDSNNSTTISVYDNYNNYINKTIPELSLEKPNVSFAKASVNLELKDARYTQGVLNNGDGNVTYTSSNPNIASVDSSTGTVTFHDIGTVTITATTSKTSSYYKATASYTLTVTKSTQTLSFLNSSVNKKATSEPFTIVPNHGTGDGMITYTSSDPTVATVDENGTVTILKTGTTNIIATASETTLYKPVSASYSLNVGLSPQTIALEYTSTTKKLSDKQFKINVTHTEGDGNLTYTSSKPEVATVNENGEITIKKVGTTTITVTAGQTESYSSTSASFSLNVEKGIPQLIIENNDPKEIEKLITDDKFKLNISYDGDGSITYTSSNPEVATIDEDGMISIKGEGTTKIKVLASESSNYETIAKEFDLKVIGRDVINNIPDTAKNIKPTIYLIAILVIVVGLLVAALVKLQSNKTK